MKSGGNSFHYFLVNQLTKCNTV